MIERDDTRNRRVLVVDDNEAIHRDFRKILCGSGREGDEALDELEHSLFEARPAKNEAPYDIETAFQGEEALDKVRQAGAAGLPYALVFLDVRMPPGIDGVETACRLLELDSNVQIVLCTAFSDHSWESMAGRFGRTDRVLILKKPFDSVEVLQLARALGEKWRLAQSLQIKLGDLDWLVRSRTRALEESNRQLLEEVRERRRTETALGAAKAEIEQILQTVPSALVREDENGFVRLWNRSAERLFTAPAASIVGRPFRDSGIGWDWERVLEEVGGRAPDEDWVARFDELDYVNREGRKGWLNVLACPLRESGDRPAGTLWFIVDVSDRRALEMQLLQAQKLEAVGRLAAGIAHEINTPTQYVSDNLEFISASLIDLTRMLGGFARLLEPSEGPPDAGLLEEVRGLSRAIDLDELRREVPQALDETRDGLRRVAEIVKAMKVFSFAGSAEKQLVDLNDAVASTVTVARHEWKLVADVETDLDSALPPVPCIPGELNQALLNLLVNAAHAIGEQGRDEPGRIRIETKLEAECARIRVEDDGPGIPAAIRDRVFDPFFTTKGIGHGTGQGLAIARAVVVDKHEGTLELERANGGGTIFTIRLPLEET